MPAPRCPDVRWVPFLAAPLVLWAVAPGVSEACFFYEEPADHTVVTQSAMQVVLKRTERIGETGGTIYGTTMILGTRTDGYVPDLGWIVAVPRHPEVDVAAASTFVSLDFATAPIFRTSSGSGASLSSADGSSGCGGADRAGGLAFPEDYPEVTVWDSTEVGPYAVEVITAPDTTALQRWVESNGLPWRPETEPDFQHYIDLGYFFVGAKVRPAADGAALVPLALTYESDQPDLELPLLLERREAITNMGIVVWIIADRPAVPRGWAQVVVPEAQIVVDVEGDETSNYGDLVAEAIDSVAEGQGAFVTDYSQPASTTVADLLDEPTAQLVGTEGWVTRLYTRVDPEDITVDPTFELDAAAPPVARLRDLTRVEDGPYWGAAFRPVYGFAPLALVLLGRLLRRRR